MNAGKITAKLRDAVPVCLYENGNEQGRFRNIELPDSIKALEIRDFHFDIDAAGWISFRLHFDQGILPDELPAPRPLVTREQKRAAKAAKAAATPEPIEIPDELDEAPAPGEEIHTSELVAAIGEVIVAAGGELTAEPAPGEDYTIATADGVIIAEIHHAELTDTPANEPAEAADEIGLRFDVPGKKRGKLAQAIGEALACEVVYLGPGSYAYQIGALTLDREGSLTGELPFGLLAALAERGFIPAE